MALLLPFVLAAGCTEGNDSRYPSLLPRPTESQSFAEPERPIPVAAPDPALDAQVAEIDARLDKAAQAFTSQAQTTEALIAVARGLPEGSEPWLQAQSALAGLGAAREPVNTALSDLDRLVIARGQEGQPPYPALDTAAARADKLAADQAARVDGLEAALAGR